WHGPPGLGTSVDAVDERRHRLLGGARERRACRLRQARSGGKSGGALAALDHDPLGEALADARDGLQPRRIAGGDDGEQLGHRHAREDAEAGSWAEALDLAEEVKQRALARVGESEQLDGVLAHLGVHQQPHRGAGGRQIAEGFQRHVHQVASPRAVDDQAVGPLPRQASAEARDHHQPPRSRAPPTPPPRSRAPPTTPPRSRAPPTMPPRSRAPPTMPPRSRAPPTMPPSCGRSATRSGASWRWQSASASASAASADGRRARPRRTATPRPTPSLSPL